MNLKKALIASFLLHGLLLVLSSGIGWAWSKSRAPLKTIETHLVIKDKSRNKELLPRKEKAPPPPEQEKKREKDQIAPMAKAEEPVVKKDTKDVKDASIASKRSLPKTAPSKYVNKLASLSEMYAKEITEEKITVPEGEVEDDSYFDRIHTLIKESFVVPKHLDGPRGAQLQAVIRLFLASDGSLNKLTLETPSGDEHFDKAVIDGTKRVSNFGAVPVLLQDVMRERGLVVELCPVKCQKSSKGE